MPAVWLLLLALGLPGGCRCPGGGPRALPPHNETLSGAGGARRAPDVALLVAVGGWLGGLLLYVGRFVRRSRAETRLHLEYLRALSRGGPPGHRQEEEEKEPLSTFLGGSTGSKAGSAEG